MKWNRVKAAVLLGTTITLMLSLSGCGNDKARENQDAYKTIGITAMEKGEYDDAITAFQSALDQSLASIGANELDICYYKAMAQYLGGKMEDAIGTYTALIDYDSKNSEAYFLRGNIYLDQADEKSALEDYKNAVKYDSKNLELYISVYENLSGAGYEADGQEILKQGTEVSGSKAEDYARRGRVYTLLGDYDNAAGELEKAVDAGNVDALLYKGQLLEAQGNSADAQTLYENYISQREGDVDALNTLGCMKMSAGDYASALTYFKQALESAGETDDTKEILKNEILAFEYNAQFAEAKAAMEEYAAKYSVDDAFQREYLFLQTR